MSEHWEVDTHGFNIKEVGKAHTVAMLQPHADIKARARLIAAAPDLYEALKMLRDTFHSNEFPREALKLADAALAKVQP